MRRASSAISIKLWQNYETHLFPKEHRRLNMNLRDWMFRFVREGVWGIDISGVKKQ